MTFGNVWLAPVLATVSAFIAFASGYIMAVLYHHVKPWISYISDGGAHPPESCLFGQFLNMSAVFLALTAYVRHLHIVQFYGKLHHTRGHWKAASKSLLCLGFLISVGVSIVANFQETSMKVVHGIGASLAFICGVIYLWGQVLLVNLTKPMLGSYFHNILRIIMASITTVALTTHLIFFWGRPLSPKTADGESKEPRKDGVVWIDVDSPYFLNHAIAVLSEWILVITLYLHILSFALDLRKTEALAPVIIPKSKNDQHDECIDRTVCKGVSQIHPVEQNERMDNRHTARAE